MRTVAALLVLLAVSAADRSDPEYAQWSARASDDDLFTYVTRPDLRPPKLNIALHKKDRTASGYIFVAPYDCLECNNVPATTYSPQQIGPHIYTEDGELVWSGGELLPNTKVFDFKALMIDGEHYLSFIAPPDSAWQPYPDGVAMVLDASYQPIFEIDSEELGHRIDMHEFNVLEDGQSALIGMTHRRELRASDHVYWKGEILDSTFVELDIRTQEQIFSWTASEHIPFTESSHPPPSTLDTQDKPWDWFQLNSMDKDKFGNYLISARATNTIYYISPEDGSIIWQLGGIDSSFDQDFNFSRQHHARVQNQNQVNMVISFFDNAADDVGWEPTSTSSGMKVVGLDLENMVARLYHVHERPDGGLTETNGNVQFLPNGGVFGGWGENGMMTEYINRGGQKLYEASFASKRFTNYRAFKMEFVAEPVTKPDLKGFVSTNSRGQSTTNLYVSWNGATEVASWRFWSHAATHGVEKNIEIGQVPRSGFETTFTAMGYHPITFVEALNIDGNILANSSLELTEIPKDFHDAKNPMYDKRHSRPADSLALRTAVAFIGGLAVATIWGRVRGGKNTVSWKSGPPRWAAGSLRWSMKRSE